MQRNDDADRIIAEVPWSTQKRELGDEIYYDPVVHDAQLLYLLARHFPTRLGAVPPAALEDDEHGRQRQPGRARCRRPTRCWRSTPTRKPPAPTHARHRGDRQGRPQRALTLPAGAMPKADRRGRGEGAVLAGAARWPAYYVAQRSRLRSQSAGRGDQPGHRGHPRVPRREGQPGVAGEGRRGVLRPAAAARDRRAIGSRRSRSSICCRAASRRCSSCSRRPTRSTPGADPAMHAAARRAARRCPSACPDKSTGLPSHVDVRDDRLVLYGDAGRTPARSSIACGRTTRARFRCRRRLPKGMYNRTIAGAEPPAHARGRSKP